MSMDGIHSYLHEAVYTFGSSVKWLLICIALFVPLAHLFPGKPGQPYWRKDMLADMTYWFVGPFFYAPFYIFFVATLLALLYSPQARQSLTMEGLPPVRNLPLWLQAFIMLLATDFLQYWMHRFFHTSKLWKFHAVHHSSPTLDWMSSARFHPVNIIFYSTLMNAIVYMIGFSPGAFAELFVFNSLYSPLVHANLNWTYGPFKYVMASPVFHRWHHTSADEGGSKNFAPTFPFIDLMFGTFYMPEGVQPSVFGTPDDPVPPTFWGQIAYPFRKKKSL